MNSVQKSSHRVAGLVAALAFVGTGVHAADFKLGAAGELEIKGDLRLRQESKTEEGATTADNKTNNRQRYRLRVGMNYKIDSKLSVKTQFASGTGEQTSTNQTMGATRRRNNSGLIWLTWSSNQSMPSRPTVAV
jgi:outer membrane autotransporter protein